MDPKGAIRRLLKSRLRLHILQAVAVERPQENWQAASEVEAGIERDAWEAWRHVRSSHQAWQLEGAVRQALAEAIGAAEVLLDESSQVAHAWVLEKIAAWVGAFDSASLWSEP